MDAEQSNAEKQGWHEQRQRARLNHTELAFTTGGAGEPVLFLHPAIVADAFVPLLAESALADRYRLIHYHRRGYGESARQATPLSMTEQAADAHALLRHLGIARAHVVGHSFGGAIALQLALDAPEAVHSLALLEPILPAALADPTIAQFFMATVGQAFAQYAAGDKADAIDTWARGAFGPDYRSVLDRILPGAFGQAVSDADTLFQVEAPVLQQWNFTAVEAAHIKQPVLSVYHHDSIWAGFVRTHELLCAWLPQSESFVLPAATHLLQMMNPRGMAETLSSFFRRHTLTR